MNTKTHLTYLLGRFKDANVAQDSFSFLLDIKNSDGFKEIENLFNEYKQNAEKTSLIKKQDRAELLFLRSIYISLIYLNQGDRSKKISEEYINFCIKKSLPGKLKSGFSPRVLWRYTHSILEMQVIFNTRTFWRVVILHTISS